MLKSPEEMRVEGAVGQMLMDVCAGVPSGIAMEALFRAFCSAAITAADDFSDIERMAARLPEDFLSVSRDQWANIRAQLERLDGLGSVQ